MDGCVGGGCVDGLVDSLVILLVVLKGLSLEDNLYNV